MTLLPPHGAHFGDKLWLLESRGGGARGNRDEGPQEVAPRAERPSVGVGDCPLAAPPSLNGGDTRAREEDKSSKGSAETASEEDKGRSSGSTRQAALSGSQETPPLAPAPSRRQSNACFVPCAKRYDPCSDGGAGVKDGSGTGAAAGRSAPGRLSVGISTEGVGEWWVDSMYVNLLLPEAIWSMPAAHRMDSYREALGRLADIYSLQR